jgi:hypothetical protein
MKKIFLLICALHLVKIVFCQGQKIEKSSFGIFIAKSDFIGDQNIQTFKFGDTKGAVGLNYNKNVLLNSSIGINVALGNWGTKFNRSMGPLTGKSFNSSFFISDINFRHNLRSKIKYNFVPFLSVGIGCRLLSKTSYPSLDSYGNIDVISTNKRTIEPVIPFGIGFIYQLSPKLNLQYQYTFGLTNSDHHDFKVDKLNFLENDFYGINQIGLAFKIFTTNCAFF